MLRRIPAVKWAFTRLRPLPHSGSIDVAANEASDSPAILADVAEAAPVRDASSAEPLHGQADITVTTPVVEAEPAISVIVESPSATPAGISLSDEPSGETSVDVEPAVVEQASVLPVDVASEQVEAPEVVSNDPPAQSPASVEPVIVEEAPVSSIEVASELADAPEAVIGSVPSFELATEIEPAAAEETPVASVDVASEHVAAPAVVGNDPPAELLASIEPVIVEETPVSSVAVASEPAEALEAAIGSVPSYELVTEIEPAAAEETPVASVDVAIDAVDAPVLLVTDDSAPDVLVDDAPAAIDGSCVACADDNVLDVSESSIDGDPSPSVAAEIEPATANDPAPVMVVAAEDSSAEAASGIADSAPEPALESPVPEISRAAKARAKVTEPTDRAALIRQRWAETGIRMWNPRLHGSGDATLNIQGRIGLLPPAPGETMPRYDKLEFKMLGGQIVCEGVIVEAPAQADRRSFTRLAEPRHSERVREPARERQAALA
ncbi:hypothetical protein FOM02_16610 [Bradyrhizobium sp. SEMIA]|nr:hypothetical protein FOM02_16610 [Bradyrhizobium sp. SEMIA]